MATYSVVHLRDINMKDRIDAEYYQQDFLRIADRLRNSPPLKKIAKPITSAFYPPATQIYSIGNIPFLRCVDVIHYPVVSSLQNAEFERIPDSFVDANKTIKKLSAGNIVITKVGTPCYASVIDRSLEEVALSRTVLGLVDLKIDPYYLVAFLRSKYGFLQLMRERELTIQLQLTLERVGRIRVFVPCDDRIKEISSKMRDYFRLLKESYGLYESAQRLFSEQFDTTELDEKYPCSYTVSVSETKYAHRIDADYFQPKYRRIIKKIESYSLGSKSLGDIVKIKDKNFFPKENVTYKYIELADIGGQGEIEGYISERGENLPTRARRLVHEGDIIISSIEGSLSCSALIHKEHDGSLCSSGFFVLESDRINSETLLMLFKSEILQYLLKRGCAGTILTSISKNELKRIPLPLLDESIQERISLKVKEAHKLRLESKQALDEALRIVENTIGENQ